MKKKITLRLLLLVVASFLICSCRNDYLPEQTTKPNPNASKFRILKLKDLPKIEAFIHKESGRKDLILPLSGNTPVSGKTTTAFGETDPSLVVEKTTGEETYYVMKINNTSGNDAVYNLEIKEVEGTIVKAEVIEYDPEAGMTLDFGNFTGTVSSYSLRGDPIHSSDYEGGEGGCPPGGGSTPGYNGSDNPDPGGNGPYYGGGNIPGTDPLTATTDCTDIVLDGHGNTMGWYDHCTGIFYRNWAYGNKLSADCGDGSGVVITNAINPCEKANIPVSQVNNIILHAPTISTERAVLENHAANSFTEYGMAIVGTGSSIIAQDPYTNNDPSNPGSINIIIPILGDYLASAHTHPSHGAAPPSVKDLYMALNNAKDYLTFQAAFVFAHNGTKYAFVITDREKAKDFLLAYPFADNTTNEGRIFNKNYAVGSDFIIILEDYMQGRLPSYSGNSQNDGMESAFAQILEKYNTGISIAKTDANGNMKPLKSVSFQYEIPASGGKKITGYRAEPCP